MLGKEDEARLVTPGRLQHGPDCGVERGVRRAQAGNVAGPLKQPVAARDQLLLEQLVEDDGKDRAVRARHLGGDLLREEAGIVGRIGMRLVESGKHVRGHRSDPFARKGAP
ncbi:MULTISPECIES: hypothetical protein [unclassified Methylobacterium]|uniref:hypothetical protein n=1 Tax=Methylobacterium sp. 2A TaxID=2603816 RepID=UPI001FEF2566|nr:hypothetical protein [Methylobacterium sp. 2A]